MEKTEEKDGLAAASLSTYQTFKYKEDHLCWCIFFSYPRSIAKCFLHFLNVSCLSTAPNAGMYKSHSMTTIDLSHSLLLITSVYALLLGPNVHICFSTCRQMQLQIPSNFYGCKSRNFVAFLMVHTPTAVGGYLQPPTHIRFTNLCLTGRCRSKLAKKKISWKFLKGNGTTMAIKRVTATIKCRYFFFY